MRLLKRSLLLYLYLVVVVLLLQYCYYTIANQQLMQTYKLLIVLYVSDDSQVLGCSTRAHPTRRYIEAHLPLYTEDEDSRSPLKTVPRVSSPFASKY